MSSKFRKLLFYLTESLVSNAAVPKSEMVRYFPNNFEDYKPGAAFKIENDAVISRITEYLNNITKRLKPSRKNADGGLYVGVTGVSYMFYYLSKNPILSERKEWFFEKALEYLKPALGMSVGERTSFLLGDAGTYAIAAVLTKTMGDASYAEHINMYQSLSHIYLNPKFLKSGGDEFFVGRAGYIAGALWIQRETGIEVIKNEDLYKICDMVVASGHNYSAKHGSPCPLMYHYYNTEYLGAAHGLSFILQMLLSVPGYLEQNESAAKDVKQTIDFLASLQTSEGNWPCCMEEIGLNDHKLVHWCHGGPGTIYLMARAYLIYNNQSYLDACIKVGELVWQKGILRKGPGLCHGVAGNGYVFLLLYRLTKDEKYMYRAKMFADFMNTDEFLREARVPDNAESLYEGSAGTVCYFADILLPDKAEFPFQDVFSY